MDKPAEKPLTKNELMKADKPDLSGTIRETLANPAADRFSGDDEQFIKFHGIYQQDDRDKRKTGKVFSVMVRTRQTGGIVPAAQYLVYDELSGRFANGTLRITSRQTFQFHGVVQQGIGTLIKSINESLSSTLATCGDVNRNITAPSNPPVDAITQSVEDDAFTLTRALLPPHDGLPLHLGGRRADRPWAGRQDREGPRRGRPGQSLPASARRPRRQRRACRQTLRQDLPAA